MYLFFVLYLTTLISSDYRPLAFIFLSFCLFYNAFSVTRLYIDDDRVISE
jgi:hypothetical protein